MDLSLQVTIIFILFLLSGYFSSAEAALFSLTDLHLHKMKIDHYPFLSFVRKLLENPRRLLITIVVGNEAVNIGISILAASFFINLFGAKGQWVAIAFSSTLLLVAGEAIPKIFGVTYPMSLSAGVSPLLLLISRIEYPVVVTLEKISSFILRRYKHGSSDISDTLMEDEFRTLIEAGSREGVVNEAQKELINRIFELGDKPAADIMVPRVDMFCLPVSMPLDEIVEEVVKARHERIPIYAGDRDDIIGIIFARDLLTAAVQAKKPEGIEKMMRAPYFIPEGKTIYGLLHSFQENRMQIAIVVDEYGGVSGMVTLEDILEHLFEEAHIRCDLSGNGCERIDESSVIVPGKLPMDQFNDVMQARLPEDEFDTIGGFVLHLFGKLPVRGEEITFDGFKFHIESVGRSRILKIKAQREDNRILNI